MIDYATEPGSPIVEIRVRGHITDDELRATMARLKSDIGEQGKTRILERIDHFTGLEPKALWTDVTQGVPLAQQIERAAIVADAAWIRGMTELGAVFSRAKVKAFRPDELDKARIWLSAG